MALYWYEKLMVTGEFDNSAEKQLKKINAGKHVSGVYLIMLSEAENTLLEIQPSQYLTQKYYREKKSYIIGAALSNELACELAARIAASASSCGGNVSLDKMFGVSFRDKPDIDSIVRV